MEICDIYNDNHRLTALLRLRSPLSTDCGNAKPIAVMLRDALAGGIGRPSG